MGGLAARQEAVEEAGMVLYLFKPGSVGMGAASETPLAAGAGHSYWGVQPPPACLMTPAQRTLLRT